jgi:hypothetical protein
MESLEEIRNTLLACLYRIKGAGVFVQKFKDCLLRALKQDAEAKVLIQEITDGSAQVAGKMEQLLNKLSGEENCPLTVSTRRQEERFVVEGEATVIINSTTKKTYLLKNLSSVGVGIIGSQPLRIGDKVDVIVLNPFLKNSVYEGASVRWGSMVDDKLWAGGVAFKGMN